MAVTAIGPTGLQIAFIEDDPTSIEREPLP
jgi:hypothetical protein